MRNGPIFFRQTIIISKQQPLTSRNSIFSTILHAIRANVNCVKAEITSVVELMRVHIITMNDRISED